MNTEVGPGGVGAGRNLVNKGSITSTVVQGSLDRVSDAVFDKTGLDEQLGLARFTGRRQLITNIGDFMAVNNHGWVVVEGEAGVGKSALAAHLVQSNDWFYHFTRFQGARSPESARKSLAAQLIGRFGLDRLAPNGAFPLNAAHPKYLADVLRAAAYERDKDKAASRPIVLVIDGLDEVDSDGQSSTPLGLPAAEELPHKVFVVGTRRLGGGLYTLGSPVHPESIEIGETTSKGTNSSLGSANTQDMREYLRGLLDGPDPDPVLVKKLRSHDTAPGVFIETLVTRCAGVWIYLKYVLDEVRAGSRTPADVMSLPQGLRSYYLEQISRQRELDREKWWRFRCSALATLAALRRPATVNELASLAGVDDGDKDELWDWLDEHIQALLLVGEDPISGDSTYEIYHQSLRDLMAVPDSPGRKRNDHLGAELRHALRDAHAAITAHLMPSGPPGLRKWADANEYVRDVLAEHAAYSDRLDELVTDPGFLLICQPSSVLARRRYLKNSAGILAVSAYEAALGEWAKRSADEHERAWWLHVWARKTRAFGLAAACGPIAERTPVIQAAIWTGTTHRAIHAHVGSVEAITVLPVLGGRPFLASGGADGHVRLLDPAAGTLVGDALGNHGWVTAIAAARLRNGRTLLATGGRDGTIRLWDPDTCLPAGDPIAAHSGPVNAITITLLADDHIVLATGGRDGTIRLWDPDTCLPAGDPIAAHSGPVNAMTVAKLADDHIVLASGGRDGTIRLWDPDTGTPAGDAFGNHGWVTAIAAARLRNGRTLLATGGRDGTIRLWDPDTRLPAGDPIAAHSGPVNAMTVAKLTDRTLLITGSHDRTVRLWDPATGGAVPPSLTVRARWVNAIAAVPLPDGRTLIATGGSDGKIELQEVREPGTGAPENVPPAGHSSEVNAITVAKLTDRTLFVTGSRDRTVRLWDPSTGDPALPPLAGHGGPVGAVTTVPLPGGRTLLATSGADGTVRLWDLLQPRRSRLLKRYAQVHAITAVELPDRTLLATGGLDGMLRLWDPVTGVPVTDPLEGHAGPVNAITAVRLPGGRTLIATGGSDGTIRLWDPAVGAAAGGPLVGYGGKIRALATVRLPDARTLLAAGGDHGVVHVWEEGTRIAVIEPAAGRAGVNAIATVELPGRTLLVTAYADGDVRLWDPVTGQPAGDPLEGHDGPVKAMAAMRLPDGQVLLATGGSDKAVLIWTFGDGAELPGEQGPRECF